MMGPFLRSAALCVLGVASATVSAVTFVPEATGIAAWFFATPPGRVVHSTTAANGHWRLAFDTCYLIETDASGVQRFKTIIPGTSDVIAATTRGNGDWVVARSIRLAGQSWLVVQAYGPAIVALQRTSLPGAGLARGDIHLASNPTHVFAVTRSPAIESDLLVTRMLGTTLAPQRSVRLPKPPGIAERPLDAFLAPSRELVVVAQRGQNVLVVRRINTSTLNVVATQTISAPNGSWPTELVHRDEQGNLLAIVRTGAATGSLELYAPPLYARSATRSLNDVGQIQSAARVGSDFVTYTLRSSGRRELQLLGPGLATKAVVPAPAVAERNWIVAQPGGPAIYYVGSWWNRAMAQRLNPATLRPIWTRPITGSLDTPQGVRATPTQVHALSRGSQSLDVSMQRLTSAGGNLGPSPVDLARHGNETMESAIRTADGRMVLGYRVPDRDRSYFTQFDASGSAAWSLTVPRLAEGSPLFEAGPGLLGVAYISGTEVFVAGVRQSDGGTSWAGGTPLARSEQVVGLPSPDGFWLVGTRADDGAPVASRYASTGQLLSTTVLGGQLMATEVANAVSHGSEITTLTAALDGAIVERIAADGSVRWSRVLSSFPAFPTRGVRLVPTSDGGVILYTGEGSTPLESISAAGSVRWSVPNSQIPLAVSWSLASSATQVALMVERASPSTTTILAYDAATGLPTWTAELPAASRGVRPRSIVALPGGGFAVVADSFVANAFSAFNGSWPAAYVLSPTGQLVSTLRLPLNSGFGASVASAGSDAERFWLATTAIDPTRGLEPRFDVWRVAP